MPPSVAVFEVVNGDAVPAVAHLDRPSASARKRAAIGFLSAAVIAGLERSAILKPTDREHRTARRDAAKGGA